ncbi:EamA family transporter RarD [Propioniciclava tarda]|uniref:EamA family transporter RarD n=1 Tax=Propioniciclava tarda TaxID=433330 RepID=A0A4Q9KKA8_PROTD|nr:EamA family transporter RarD [Propioniciclava tarda]TBT94922.1 EamA family transporter RarD [Propioniciclava tarda]SMO58244.1 chloramphenicol-sensitive protein RarD [Propioniciclava tarda]HOA89538.1 EamA family transporter RarD [Propioniciclava tarda]HQA31657.1 EamA family transporter RarD [Propioniciclava tarda]HQD61409.1 EamA family transporter RarD [Propioniciclava tarda]
MTRSSDAQRTGLLAGVTAYFLWGLFPLYWPLLKPAGAFEILAHRIVWSFVSVLLVLLVLRQSWRWVAGVFTRANFPRLLAATLLIALNWVTYIFAVNSGHVVEASLGYFINPLANVLFGVLFFGERLGRGGRLGGLLAVAGVVVIAWGSFETLWVSLTLALSFGLYGVAKKKAHLPALQGLLVESGLLVVPCAAFLIVLAATGTGQFGTSVPADALLMLTGPITAIPLWLFAIAAPRLPLGVVGILQYLAPTIQFMIGVLVVGQHVTPTYWLGLVLVWIGSAVYLREALSGTRASTPDATGGSAH